jgi:hypothetical protein
MNATATALIAIGIGLSLLNWLCLLSSLLRGRFFYAVFPAPSLLTAIGLAILDSTRPYWWVGLFTDHTLFGLLASTPRLVADAWRLSSFTRQQLLTASDGPRHFTLSLHRNGYFLLRGTFDPGVPSNEHGAFINSFGAPGRWEQTSDGQLRLWSYRGDRELMLQSNSSFYIAHESHYPDDAPFPYGRLEGLQFQTATA